MSASSAFSSHDGPARAADHRRDERPHGLALGRRTPYFLLGAILFTRRLGAKPVHAVYLTLAGIGMWLAGSIPPERAGVYMGIFNMFIVIPMLIQNVTLPLFYNSLLGGNPANVIRLAGTLLIIAAVCVLFVKVAPTAPER